MGKFSKVSVENIMSFIDEVWFILKARSSWKSKTNLTRQLDIYISLVTVEEIFVENCKVESSKFGNSNELN